MNSIKIS